MKLKDFLLQLENDMGLRDRYRKANRGQRKQIGKEQGLTDSQADILASDDLAQIRTGIEQEEPGTAFFFVVM